MSGEAAGPGSTSTSGTPREGTSRPNANPWLRFERLSWIVFGLFVLFVYVPIAKAISRGVLVGGDWSEYALTAHQYLTHGSSLFTYPTPVLPLVYVPLELVTTNPVAIAIAAPVISGLLLLGLFLGGLRLFHRLTGSPWAGLLGATMMTTGPLFLDEVGWSGQSQYLAILFGILALTVLLDRLVRDDRPRWAVGVAGCLTGSALTEPYVASFFVITSLLLFLLVYRRNLLAPHRLAVAAAVLVVPIGTIGALAVLNASTTATVSSQSAIAVLGVAAIYPALLARLTFANLALEVLYPLVVVAYVLTRSRRAYPDSRFEWLVPSLALAWVPQFVFLTPSADLDRSLYFLFVPLGAMVAEIAVSLPSVWSRTSSAVVKEDHRRPASPWDRAPRDYAIPVVALVAVLTVGVQVGVATHTYYGSLSYYSYPQGDLSELAFLQHENGSLLYISPSQEFFPAAWASGRPIYPGPPAQPALFTRPAQVNAAEVANVLALGSSWISAGNIWVIDSEPEWSAPAPGLLELSSNYLLETLALDDAFQTITISPAGAPNVNLTYSLAAAPSIVHSTNASAILTTYAWSAFNVTKSVSLAPGGSVAIAFDYSAPGATVRTINITVEAPNRLSTRATAPSSPQLGPVSLTQTYQPGVVPIEYTDVVDVTVNGLVGNSTFRAAAPSFPANVLTELHPSAVGLSRFGATVLITPGVSPSYPGSVVTERPVLSANDINWVAIEKGSGQSYLERFYNDPSFSLFDNTTHYLVFETRWS